MRYWEKPYFILLHITSSYNESLHNSILFTFSKLRSFSRDSISSWSIFTLPFFLINMIPSSLGSSIATPKIEHIYSCVCNHKLKLQNRIIYVCVAIWKNIYYVPALSYPLYSSRFNPLMSKSRISFLFLGVKQFT